MLARLKKLIALSTTLLCSLISLNAQVIYLGGINDGFAKSSYIEPGPASDIYSGGINDGFAVSTYVEPDPNNDIYRGGANDGFALNSYSEPDPANDIFAGGINDGFAFNSYLEPDPAGDIYNGGVNDGFAKAYFNEELALPVEWKYFTIIKNSGRPLLQWCADKEEKCLGYEVLRSNDGKNFESVSSIECQGKPFDNKYEFEDYLPLWHRIYYYKIAQSDIDGVFTYSEVKAFHSSLPSNPDVFYHNGEIIVRVDREAKLRSVSVFDFTGRTLCRQIAVEQDGYYKTDCQLSSHQLVIIQLAFDSFTHTTHMRLR